MSMPSKTSSGGSKGFRLGLLIASVVGLVTGGMAWYQVEQERQIDLEDLNRRAHALAHQLSDTILASLSLPDAKAKENLAADVQGHSRLIGYAVFRGDGRPLTSGKDAAEFFHVLQEPVNRALNSKAEVIEQLRSGDTGIHMLAYPLHDPSGLIQGVLVVLHETSHLEARATTRLLRFVSWIFVVTLLLAILVGTATWAVYERPLQHLADWMRRLRTGNIADAPPRGLPTELLASESDRLAASFRAARAAGQT
jgi:HAMP domain-containing protein